MANLLDVNALIALVDSDHTNHEQMHRWFRAHSAKAWATCPITENGMVRALSQPAYPSGQRSPSEVIRVLGVLKASFPKSYVFWPESVSLSDESLFDPAFIIGPKHLTDAYLLGLAERNHGRLVSFDRSLPWQAIRGGSSKLVVTPE